MRELFRLTLMPLTLRLRAATTVIIAGSLLTTGCMGDPNFTGPSPASSTTIGLPAGRGPAPASMTALVQTDQDDYQPGSVVTISGNNSNGAGYLAAETVMVSVEGPNGFTASCDAIVSDDGSWSCQITLWNDERAIGSYTYVSSGETSGVSENGTFTDAPVNVQFATTGLPASTAVSVPWSGTNNGGNPISGTTSFNAPGPAAVAAFQDNTTVTCTFPASIIVSGTTYNLTTNPCPLNAGAGGPPTPTRTFTAAYTAATPPSNVAPTIEFTNPPTTATEGETKTFVFAITDAAADTHTFATGYPDCGAGNTLVSGSASIDDAANTGTFQCTFADGLDPAAANTVKVQVNDQGSLASNELTQLVTVSNVDPVVAAPVFPTTQIQCRSSVALGGISFTDPGLIDYPWGVTINWGDGSTNTSFNTNVQGPQGNQLHTYNDVGSFSAGVQVIDKDGGTGSNTSSNSVEVLQAYTVDFLPPFDDSSPASGLIVNKMKSGRVVPVKVRIFDVCTQSLVTDPAAVVTIKVTRSAGGTAADDVEEYADAGESSAGTDRFRQTDDFWIYNLDSKYLGMSVGVTYRIDVYVGAVKATSASWAVLLPTK